MNNYAKKHVLILGAARQGLALARWLSKHASNVTLNDARSSDDLSLAQASLKDTNVKWVTGSHPLELLNEIDMLCISGGVPLDLPIIQEAIKRNIPLSNDSQIFMEAVPCKTIGITGSAGKTTTTTLVGNMAKFDCEERRKKKACTELCRSEESSEWKVESRNSSFIINQWIADVATYKG